MSFPSSRITFLPSFVFTDLPFSKYTPTSSKAIISLPMIPCQPSFVQTNLLFRRASLLSLHPISHDDMNSAAMRDLFSKSSVFIAFFSSMLFFTSSTGFSNPCPRISIFPASNGVTRGFILLNFLTNLCRGPFFNNK